MNEVKFNKHVICIGGDDIECEWATKVTGRDVDLVVHFFLKKGRQDDAFLDILYQAAVEKIRNNQISVNYTNEFGIDGHDIVVEKIMSWQGKGIFNALIKRMEGLKDERDPHG